MTRLELTNYAREIEGLKIRPEKIIEKKHLDYLNKLAMLFFEIRPKFKPSFVAMYVFAYFKPTTAMMKV